MSTQTKGLLVTDTGKTLLGETATATFSEDRAYRYRLTRTWDPAAPVATFVMLNPSTADAFTADPTVRRCIAFARRWGCGGLAVLNLFALRSTDPRGLHDHADPVGPGNDAVLTDWAQTHAAAGAAGPVVAAWGGYGVLHDRGAAVAALLIAQGVRLQALAITRGGQPGHPLYLRGDSPLTEWSPS